MIMYKGWRLIILLLLAVLAACNDGKDAAPEPVKQEQENEKQDKATESKDEIESTEATTDDKKKMDNEDYPAVPSSFAESADYPITGEFAGDETYQREFSGKDDIQEVLDQFPKVTEDSSEQDKQAAKRYLFSLFKEDLKKVDVPLDQWESMQFTDPEGKKDGLQLKENYNVAILLDASGSMANLENGETRMKLAKESINNFVENLPEEANISLRVYGHIGTGSDADKKKSCSKVEEVYPLGKYDEGKFSGALNKFEPAGWTPMAKAIQQVEKDFGEHDGETNTNIVYIVSDGVETCGGSPVEAIKSLNNSNIDPVVNIIGYQVDNEGLKQLKEMADASEGRYINVKNQEDLTAEFEQTADMAELWAEWKDDAKDTVIELNKTIKEQLNNWHKNQKDLMNREHKNLEAAVYYLRDNDILDRTVYLEYIDDYRDYYLDIHDQERGQYLELHDANTDEFFEKYDEVEKRYMDAVE
jgi:Ca-activated chloride channel family protein